MIHSPLTAAVFSACFGGVRNQRLGLICLLPWLPGVCVWCGCGFRVQGLCAAAGSGFRGGVCGFLTGASHNKSGRGDFPGDPRQGALGPRQEGSGPPPHPSAAQRFKSDRALSTQPVLSSQDIIVPPRSSYDPASPLSTGLSLPLIAGPWSPQMWDQGAASMWGKRGRVSA